MSEQFMTLGLPLDVHREPQFPMKITVYGTSIMVNADGSIDGDLMAVQKSLAELRRISDPTGIIAAAFLAITVADQLRRKEPTP